VFCHSVEHPQLYRNTRFILQKWHEEGRPLVADRSHTPAGMQAIVNTEGGFHGHALPAASARGHEKLYNSLNPQAREIRFVTFTSQDTTAELDLTLSIAQFDDHKDCFQALSYTWGSESTTLPITINGHKKHVTPNLQAALRCVQRTPAVSNTNLWIDALCINQDDEVEKSHQVAMMGDIYSSARQVIVWLGEADRDSRVAFSLIKDWTALLQENELTRGLCEFVIGSDDVPPATLNLEADDNKNDAAEGPQRRLVESLLQDAERRGYGRYVNQESFTSFRAFQDRPYWKRVWIIQERVLAKKGLILCGDDALDMQELYLASYALRALLRFSDRLTADETAPLNALINGPVDVILETRASRIRGVYPWDRKIQVLVSTLGNQETDATISPGNLDLWSLLRLTRNYESKYAVDKIFGLLGMLAAEERLVEVDYSLSQNPHKLYTLVVAGHAGRKGSLEMLAFGGIKSLGSGFRMPNLPSWVPDFNDKAINSLSYDPRSYNASGILQARISQLDLETGELVAQGIWVGDIVATCPSHDECDIAMVVLGWAEFLLGLGDPPRNRAWVDILFHSLLCANGVHKDVQKSVSDTMVALFSGMFLEIASKQGVDEDDVAKFITKSQPDGPDRQVSRRLRKQALRARQMMILLETLGKTTEQLNSAIGAMLEWVTNNQRVLCMVEGEKIGFAPREVRTGDRICVLLGCSVPLVVRYEGLEECSKPATSPSPSKYQIIGYVPLPGLLDGEATHFVISSSSASSAPTSSKTAGEQSLSAACFLDDICFI